MIIKKIYETNEKVGEFINKAFTDYAIKCSGCRVDGVKTPFCDSLCQIRQCGLSKKFETCGSCKYCRFLHLQLKKMLLMKLAIR